MRKFCDLLKIIKPRTFIIFKGIYVICILYILFIDYSLTIILFPFIKIPKINNLVENFYLDSDLVYLFTSIREQV